MTFRREATVFRDGVGASSGAPAQDHFGFAHGPEVVPLGVEISRAFHGVLEL